MQAGLGEKEPRLERGFFMPPKAVQSSYILSIH